MRFRDAPDLGLYHHIVPLNASSRDALLHHARRVIRQRLCNDCREFPQPEDLALRQPAGSFVSLHEMITHRLRGCVGRLDAASALWDSVRQSALAVLTDPRFAHQRVRADELHRLTIEISVISPLRPCSAAEFDLRSDGIYLTFGDRAGCFLPQVARDTGWSREQLLERLCLEKLRLPADTWRHPQARLFVFLTEQLGPEPFTSSGVSLGE
jgi:AmmeMemoRadiSam system protein A